MLLDSEFTAWDHYVSNHPDSNVYHLSVWRHIFGEAFGKQWFVVGVYQGGQIRGGVPLIHMQSRLFGNFLVSMPYVNYGGMLVDNQAFVALLLQGAMDLGESLGVNHIEFRHLVNFLPGLPVKSEKVSMWLALPQSHEALLERFKPKLRSQIRKGEKNGLLVKQGGVELLDDFYTVFSENMRDLGTPVYCKDIFRLILEDFSKTSRIMMVVDQAERPLAGGFLLGYRDRVEIPWASSLRKFNHLQSNMFLYWNCLKYACEQGYAIFDFGRSSKGASTYKFKEQWGAQPVSHYWHYSLNGLSPIPQLNPENPKYRIAIACWRQLPIVVSRILGPHISKHLP